MRTMATARLDVRVMVGMYVRLDVRVWRSSRVRSRGKCNGEGSRAFTCACEGVCEQD